MSVQLDWQQDLEDEGWPRRHDYGPPNQGPRLGRYALIAVVLLLAAGAAVLWMLNQRGLKAVEADVQEAVTYIHWTLQQDNPELTVSTLDGISPGWATMIRAEWPRLSASAQNVPPPSVETVSMNGDIAEATVRWTDAATGMSYLARRWFRLDGTQWLWTYPRSEDSDDLDTEQLDRVTLFFHPDDGENALTILPQLDDMIASRCQEFSVPEQSCHFYIQWDFADGNGQPLPWRDMPLPPLAATSGDVMDAPIYLVNGRQADWQSAELRRRLQEYYPGRAFVAQSDVEMMRPANVRSLPASLLGDPYYPLILPSPSLEGVDDNGQPHPRWLAHVDRLLTDLVMRQSEGFTLGSAEYVNGTWALHQALLAIAAGFPAAGQLITADNEAPPSALPVEIPDLAGLGAALQSNPDDVALSQLAGLVRYLQAGWTVQELDRLPQRLGTAASLDLLLQEMLDTDVESFTAGWRQQELSQADSPLSGLVQTIVDLTQEEAVAWLDSRWQALKFYSGDGRAWLMRNPSDNAVLGSLSPNDHWQVDVTGIGATGPYVWAEMTLDDGEQLARDLRFYVFDEANGWLRHSPVRAFWGDSRSLSDDLVRWSYHEIDEAAVQAVAPLVEDAYAKVIEDIGLAPLPISVTVKADTEVSWDPDSWSSDIDAPSPRSYVLDIHGDNGTDALRRDVLVRLLVFWHRRAMELAISQVSENNATFIFPSIESAFIAEREAFDVQFATSPSDQELVVRRALEEGRLPEIGVLAAGAYSAAWDSIEGRSRMLLEIYVFERHGFQWLDTMQKNGLAYTLDLVMQEKGWTLDDLEADWREFLTERSRQ